MLSGTAWITSERQRIPAYPTMSGKTLFFFVISSFAGRCAINNPLTRGLFPPRPCQQQSSRNHNLSVSFIYFVLWGRLTRQNTLRTITSRVRHKTTNTKSKDIHKIHKRGMTRVKKTPRDIGQQSFERGMRDSNLSAVCISFHFKRCTQALNSRISGDRKWTDGRDYIEPAWHEYSSNVLFTLCEISTLREKTPLRVSESGKVFTVALKFTVF